MKNIITASMLVLLSLIFGLSHAYTKEFCEGEKREIDKLDAKIKKWQRLVDDKNVIMAKFVCRPGETLLACEVRCDQWFSDSCILVDLTVWVMANEYRIEGHPKYDELKRLIQGRKDRIMGVKNGRGGLLTDWQLELENKLAEYKEKCSNKEDSILGGKGSDLNLTDTTTKNKKK